MTSSSVGVLKHLLLHTTYCVPSNPNKLHSLCAGHRPKTHTCVSSCNLYDAPGDARVLTARTGEETTAQESRKLPKVRTVGVEEVGFDPALLALEPGSYPLPYGPKRKPGSQEVALPPSGPLRGLDQSGQEPASPNSR